MLRRIGPPTTADDPAMYTVGSSPPQSSLLDVCVLLAECLTTLGQLDLLVWHRCLPCSTGTSMYAYLVTYGSLRGTAAVLCLIQHDNSFSDELYQQVVVFVVVLT